ncbi:hypothetical protein NAEGRDRAFT_79207 [Naegleria gruberi]|uniref:Uncharacterized protein n=1 Tax=Naegleria gruberi TaxID=5762 RepID=D2VAE2_NAEGR|nr:uncharacterized protein NAEGRDRAFT_79207 [Naegleria gruberi]EFC46414.1 hypothetical protein NAEGRDRAFT_79207 [Naegleria gruberi]|eukprot:XP_002679158.1 hypothetical protein NAEGRDRAFT_79207 [Naegleria gruberi strain NEG-M]
MGKHKNKPVESSSSSSEDEKKTRSSSKKSKKTSLTTPCVVQFSNSISAPPNISNVHFTLVRDEESKSFLYGESKTMQFSSNNTNQGSKYLLAVVKQGKSKPTIIDVPEFYVINEDSKQNIERKETLKREIEQGGIDSVQPGITYKQFFEKRVLGGAIVKNDGLTLFNSKKYTKIQEKRATTSATDLRKAQLQELQTLVGKTTRASALSTMQQYMPSFNIHTTHLHEVLDLKRDLLFSEKQLIEQFEEKHNRNKSLQKVWAVLEDATEETGALSEDVNVNIKSTSDFTHLPQFLQTYFGSIIDNRNWNAVSKEQRKKKKKFITSDDEQDSDQEETDNQKDFSTFLQTVAGDIPAIAHYYMVMLGLFQISQAKRFKDHAQNIIRTCYVNGILDRKQTKKAGKKEKEEKEEKKKEKKDTGIESVEAIFPNAPVEAMKKHPYLFLPKSSKCLQDLLLRFAVTDEKTRPRELRHLNVDKFICKTVQVRIACHLLASALLMCNFYMRKELVAAIQKDTKMTTEKILMCFNSMGVSPDTQSSFARKMISRMSRGGAELVSLAKEDENKKPDFNPFNEVNFYLSLPKLKQNFGFDVKEESIAETTATATATTEKPSKKSSKKSKIDVVEVLEVQEKPSKKKVYLSDDEEEVPPEEGNMKVDGDIDAGLLNAFQADEDDDEFKADEEADEEDEKDDEMVDLVDEDEEEEIKDDSDEEEIMGSDSEEEQDDEDDEMGGLIDALGTDLDMEDDSDEDLDDEEAGIRDALGKKRKNKDEDDDDEESGSIKSNKKRKHDFEQDIEEGEEDSEEDSDDDE